MKCMKNTENNNSYKIQTKHANCDNDMMKSITTYKKTN